MCHSRVEGGVPVNNEQLKVQLANVRDGDNEAFADIYNDMKTPLFTIICRITRNKELAEDVLHDLFVKLHQSPPGPSVNNPRAWVFQMARNLAINSMRTPQMVELNEEIENRQPVFSDRVNTQIDIENAMRTLASDEIEIVSLRVYGDFKFREIADILQLPLGTALWKYQKTVKKLRTYLNGGSI